MSKKEPKNWEEVVDKEVPETKIEEEDEEAADTEQKAALEHPDYQQLEDKLTAVEADLHENRDKYLRAQAELDNIRRRSERELEKAHKYAVENFVKGLLPVVDSLEKGLQAFEEGSAEAKALHEGVEMTLKLFLDTLKKFSIEPIDPLGEPFDPTKHEAISMMPNPEMEPNMVMDVFQKGYQLNGRVIRPAMVVVTKGETPKIDEKA